MRKPLSIWVSGMPWPMRKLVKIASRLSPACQSVGNCFSVKQGMTEERKQTPKGIHCCKIMLKFSLKSVQLYCQTSHHRAIKHCYLQTVPVTHPPPLSAAVTGECNLKEKKKNQEKQMLKEYKVIFTISTEFLGSHLPCRINNHKGFRYFIPVYNRLII